MISAISSAPVDELALSTRIDDYLDQFWRQARQSLDCCPAIFLAVPLTPLDKTALKQALDVIECEAGPNMRIFFVDMTGHPHGNPAVVTGAE